MLSSLDALTAVTYCSRVILSTTSLSFNMFRAVLQEPYQTLVARYTNAPLIIRCPHWLLAVYWSVYFILMSTSILDYTFLTSTVLTTPVIMREVIWFELFDYSFVFFFYGYSFIFDAPTLWNALCDDVWLLVFSKKKSSALFESIFHQKPNCTSCIHDTINSLSLDIYVLWYMSDVS